MRRWLEILGVAAGLALAGCAGETFAPDVAPEFVVTVDRTPFYRLGPQQAMAPDAWLTRGDPLRLLRREFGYSFALLADGTTGYVANDALEPAAPAAPAPVAPSVAPVGGIIEEPLPKPDLGESPADAPAF